MKKLLIVIVAGVFTACGSNSSSTTADSIGIRTDSSATMSPDTSHYGTDSSGRAIDTTRKMADSTVRP